MKTTDYQTVLNITGKATDVFRCINHVSGWWTENLEGSTQRPGDVFTVRFGQTYMTLNVVELVPDQAIVWYVVDCHKHWLKDTKEWKDTRINWSLSAYEGGTQILFSHHGLVPSLECFDVCSNAWAQYLQSLQDLISGGKGKPDAR